MHYKINYYKSCFFKNFNRSEACLADDFDELASAKCVVEKFSVNQFSEMFCLSSERK